MKELVKGKKKESKDRRERNAASEQRCTLYRKWMYPAVPSIQLYFETLLTKKTMLPADHCSIPGCFHSLSVIHSFIFPLRGALSPPIIASCPQTASVLAPVSAVLSNSPALISQLLQIKREVSCDYSKPSLKRLRENLHFTPREIKSAACYLWGCPKVWLED